MACGPGSPELSKSYMDMAIALAYSKLFTFTFTFTHMISAGNLLKVSASIPRVSLGFEHHGL